MWKNLIDTFKNNLHVIWGLVIVAFLILFAYIKVNTNDFWWLMALGRNFWETKEFINTDVFSFSVPGGYFWNHSRLFDVIIYLLYKHFGFISLQIMMLIATAVSYWFFYKTVALKTHYKLITLLTIIITLNLLIYRVLYRPELFSLLLTTIFLFILFKNLQKNTKLLWLLPLLMVVWANSHAGFVYGLTIFGIFLLSSLIKYLIIHRNKIQGIFQEKNLIRLFLSFLLSCLAIFFTSYGWNIIDRVWRLLFPGEAVESIAEWQQYSPLDFLQLANPVAILTLSALLIIIIKIVKLPKPRKIKDFPWEEILLFIFYLYSAITYVRFIYISSLIMALIVARNIRGVLPEKYVFKKQWPHAFLLLYSLTILMILQSRPFGIGPRENYDPEKAVEFIKEYNIPGNMLNEYGEGGYLTFNLYPDKQVFIDGRTPNLYDNQFFWYYKNLPNDSIRKLVTEKYDINFWLWPLNASMQKILWQDEQWILIYLDSLSTIYIKNDPANQEIIDQFGYKFFIPIHNYQSLKTACENDQENENPQLKNNFINELEKGLSVDSDNWFIMSKLALVYQSCDYQETDLPKIKDYLIKAHQLNPGDKNINYQLGFLYLQENDNNKALYYFKNSPETGDKYVGIGTSQYNLGKYKEALKSFKKAWKISGKDIDIKYYQNIGRVYYSLDKNKLAIDYYHRYQDIANDYSAESYTDLVQAYYYDGQIDKAKDYLNKALEQDPQYPKALEMKEIIQ